MNRRGPWIVGVALAVAAGIAGAGALGACGDGVPRPPAMDPVSADEAATLAREFDAAIEPCDADRLEKLFDSETVARRIVNKADIPASEKRGGLNELQRRNFSVARQLCLGFVSAARFDLLRIRQNGATHRPLFRMLTDGTVNYYDLELGKSKTSGVVRIVDLYVYTSGEDLTTTLAGLIEQGLAAERRGQTVAGFQDLASARREGDWAEVRRIAEAMPERVRNTKAVRLVELQAAMEQDAPDYLAIIERFEKDFPDDPAVDLVAIDGHFLRKDLPALMRVIERLERRVGGDPYLAHVRSSGYLLEPTNDNLEKAERWSRVALDALPDVQDVWWNLATAQLQRQDHVAVVATLETIRTRFGVTFDRDAMAEQDIYQRFLVSPEFAGWWARVNGATGP